MKKLSNETKELIGKDLSITIQEATIIQDLNLSIGMDSLSPRTILILGSKQGVNITDKQSTNIAEYMQKCLV